MAFMGADSTVFAKSVLGDCMNVESLRGATIAIYDIDARRLDDSALMLGHINRSLEAGARFEKYLSSAPSA